MLITTPLPPEADGIVVSNLREARSAYVHYDAVITIEDGDMKDGLRVPGNARTRQLVQRYDDVDFDDRKSQTVKETHVAEAIAFARQFRSGRLLVHCHAGQCRSPATALAVIADRMGAGREQEAVAALLLVRPSCAPNLLVLEFADRCLGRGGALRRAWMDHEMKDGRIGGVRLLKKLAASGGELAGRTAS